MGVAWEVGEGEVTQLLRRLLVRPPQQGSPAGVGEDPGISLAG